MQPTTKMAGLAILASMMAAGLAFSPCVDQRKLPDSVAGFRVHIQALDATGGDGSASNPYDIPADRVTLRYTAQAYDQHGVDISDFQGDVAVQVTPGELLYTTTRAKFTDGKAEGELSVRKVFGRVALWLEDIHTVEGDTAEARIEPGIKCASVCPDGTECGGDGWCHYNCPQAGKCPTGLTCGEDHACYRQVQLKRKEGTWTTGVSNLLYFGHPTLRQVQWDPDLPQNDYSTMDGNFLEIDCRQDAAGPFTDGHGQLVVTGVFNEGYYVTDLAHSGTDYNHLYVYTYSFPEDLEIGDRLDRLAGTSAEFSGATQISFPRWLRAADESHDPLPFRVEDIDTLLPPSIITSGMCLEGSSGSNDHLCGHSKQNWSLEKLESARVRFENLRTPDIYLDCDFNGNQEITYSYPSPDAETDCRDACLKRNNEDIVVKDYIASQQALADILQEESLVCPWESAIQGIEPHCVRLRIGPEHVCSELSTLNQFGQWSAALDEGNGPVINLLTRESLVEFDPKAEENLGRTIEFLQGNLRQVRAARPRWIMLVGKLPKDVPPNMRP